MSAVSRALGLLSWGLLGLALLLGGGAFLASRTVTLQWAAKQAEELSGGRLRIEGITGSVLEEISADLVQWIDNGVDVTVTSLRLVYQPLALLDGLARVTRASAAQVEVTIAPSDERTRRPRRPGVVADPSALLPFLPSVPRFAIERLEVARLSVREGARQFELHGLEAGVSQDGDRINAGLMNARLVVGQSQVSLRGDAALLSRAPYVADGRFVAQWPLPALQPQPVRLELRLNGPLAELGVRANAVLAGAPVEARGVLQPFESRPLRQVRLDLKEFDLSRYDRSLPVTRLSAGLDFEVMPVWASGRRPWLIGPVTLTNAAAGPLDRRRLPLETAAAVVAVLDGRVEVQGLQASGPMGSVAGEGWLEAGGGGIAAGTGRPPGFRFALQGEQLRLRGIDGGLPARTVHARLSLESQDASAGFRLSLTASDRAIAADVTADLANGRLHIRQAQVRSQTGPAHARFEGTIGPAPSWPLDLLGDFRDVDAAPWLTAAPAVLNGSWQARGPAAGPDGGAVATAIRLQDSTYRALPLTGTLAATMLVADGLPRRLRAISADLQWGGARLDAAGSLGAASDRLRLTLAVPRAGQLDPRLDGALQAAVELSGPIRDPAVGARIDTGPVSVTAGGARARAAGSSLEWTSRSLRSGSFDLHAALADVELGPAADAAEGRLRLGRLTATVGGARDDHTVVVDAAGEVGRMRASARGGLGPDGLWRGRVMELAASHPLLTTASGQARDVAAEGDAPLRSVSPFAVQAGDGRVGLRDGRFRFPGASVVVRQADWDGATLDVKADASQVAGRWLARLIDRVDARPPDAADLLLSAAIEFQGNLIDARATDWRASVRLQRESGDLWVGGADGQAPVSAGLHTLGASATLDGAIARLVVRGGGDRVGRVALEARTLLQDRGAPAWTRSSLSLSPLSGRLEVALNSFRWIAPLAADRWQVDGSLDARLDLGGTLTRPHADGVVTGSNLSAIEPSLGLQLRNGVLAAEFAGDRVDVRMLRFEGGQGGGSVAVSGLLQAPAAGPSEARVVVDGLAIPLGGGQRMALSGSTALVLAGRSLEIVGRLAADEGVIVIDGSRGDVAGDQRSNGRSDGGRPVLRKIATAPAAGSLSSAALRPFTIDTDVGIDLGGNVRFSGAGVDAGLSGAIRLTGRSPDAPRARGVVDLVDGSYRVDGRVRRISRGRVVYGDGPGDPAVELSAGGDDARMTAGGVADRRLASTVGPLLSAGLLAACEQSLRGVWGIVKLQSEITDRLSLSVRAGSDRAMDLLWFFPFD